MRITTHMLFTCAIVGSVGLARAEEAPGIEHKFESGHTIHWADSFEEALKQAKQTQRPLMVDFTAEWCGWCKKLDRETYGDERVIRLLHDNFVSVKVDWDKRQDIAQKYEASGLPTILFLSPNGEEMQRIVGFQPPERFIQSVNKSASSSKTLVTLKRAAEKSPQDVDAQRAYARALFGVGSSDEAVEILRKARKRSPGNAALLLDLADVLRGQRNLEEACKIYENILGMEDEKAGAEKQKCHLPLARSLLSLKEHQRVTEVIGRYLKNLPADAEKSNERWEAHFLRGYAYAVLKDAPRALADMKAVRDKAPESPWGFRANNIVDVVEF